MIFKDVVLGGDPVKRIMRKAYKKANKEGFEGKFRDAWKKRNEGLDYLDEEYGEEHPYLDTDEMLRFELEQYQQKGEVKPFVTDNKREYEKRRQAYADSLFANNYYNEYFRLKNQATNSGRIRPWENQRAFEDLIKFTGKNHTFGNYHLNDVGTAGIASVDPDIAYPYGIPQGNVTIYTETDGYPSMKPKRPIQYERTAGNSLATPTDGVGIYYYADPKYSPAPVQKVVYQEKPKMYNYEISRNAQLPNVTNAQILRQLLFHNNYNLNPVEGVDYTLDKRYKDINTKITDQDIAAWNKTFGVEPYIKELTEDEAKNMEKQGYTVKRMQNGGPTDEPSDEKIYIGEYLDPAHVSTKLKAFSPGWWNKQADKLDNIAIASGFVPVVGDAASFLADVGANFARYQYDKNDPTLPEWQRKDIAKANLKSGLGLAGAAALIGLIPGVSMPSGNIKNVVKKGMKNPKQMTKNELISAYNTEIKKPSDQWDMDYLESLKKEYDKMSAEGTKAIDAEGYPVDLYHSGPEVDKFHQFDVDHDGHESMVYGTTDPIVSKTYIYKENENLPGLTDIQYVPDDYSNTEHLTKRWHFYPESVLEVEGKGSPWNRIGITDDLKNAVDLHSDLSKKYLLPLHQSEEYKKAGLTKKHMLERPIRQKISDLMRPELNKLGFQSEENLMNYYARQFRENPLYGKTTRGIEDYAKHLADKEGMIIHNIVDLGSPIPEVYNHSGLSDIYAISDPRRVKLADAVTFDEAGKPIELQYRNDFTKNNDLYGIVPPALLIGTGSAAYNRFNKKDKENQIKFDKGGPISRYGSCR